MVFISGRVLAEFEKVFCILCECNHSAIFWRLVRENFATKKCLEKIWDGASVMCGLLSLLAAWEIWVWFTLHVCGGSIFSECANLTKIASKTEEIPNTAKLEDIKVNILNRINTWDWARFPSHSSKLPCSKISDPRMSMFAFLYWYQLHTFSCSHMLPIPCWSVQVTSPRLCTGCV